MYRVLAVVEAMSTTLNEATSYLRDAIHAIDTEMTALQKRLANDALALEAAVKQADLSEDDRIKLMSALHRMEDTANAAASFAHRRDQLAPKRPDSLNG